jgi:hypothetical protein
MVLTQSIANYGTLAHELETQAGLINDSRCPRLALKGFNLLLKLYWLEMRLQRCAWASIGL